MEIVRNCFERGIDNSCPLILLVTKVIDEHGNLKGPIATEMLSPEEEVNKGWHNAYTATFDVTSRDLVFEIKVVDDEVADGEEDSLELIQRPERYTKPMLESLETLLFHYGWPHNYRRKFGIREAPEKD
ncbi:MAG: hypothetical protein QXH08_00145 [Candidatus Hadarchaeales archaeon]